MQAALLPLVLPGRRRRGFVVLMAVGLLLVLWLAAAASVGDVAPADGPLFGPFRWVVRSTSA